MSDGPPPPPPPDPAIEETETYVAYLRREGLATDGAREDPNLRVGPWRFCYRGAPGYHTESAALHPSGTVVRSDVPSDWWALLAEAGLNARGAVQRVAWLIGRAAPIGTGFVIDDPKAAAKVTEPTLHVVGGTADLRGWIVWPPNMQDPFALEITARRGVPTAPKWTRWNENS